LSERDKFAYLIAASFLQILIGRYGLFMRGQTAAGVIVVLVSLGITIWGLLRAFGMNERGDGVKFLERYVVLAVPLTLQFCALYAGLALLSYLLVPAPAEQPQAMRYAFWLSYGVALIWLYRRLGRFIAYAASAPGFDTVAG
jgi:hypothetical protein